MTDEIEIQVPEALKDMGRYFDVFYDELVLITQELVSSDSLYDEMKAAIDAASNVGKNNRRTSPHVFLFSMYSNLNANRSNKLALIKELSKLKKVIADLTFKESHGDELEEKFKSLAGTLYKQIKMVEDRNSGTSIEFEEVPDDLDSVAQIAYKEETGEEYTGPEEEIFYACDEDEGRVFTVNNHEELEIIDEIYEEDLPSLFKIELKADGTVRRCIDLSCGENVPVIRFDEE